MRLAPLTINPRRISTFTRVSVCHSSCQEDTDPLHLVGRGCYQHLKTFWTGLNGNNSLMSCTNSHSEHTLLLECIYIFKENCQSFQGILDLEQDFCYMLSFLNFATLGKHLNFSDPPVTSVTLEIEMFVLPSIHDW